jgi:hypothetical protein
VSIMSRLSKAVRSLTSNEANTDVPGGATVPPAEGGAVPRPDRDPVSTNEAERDESDGDESEREES